MIRAFIEGVLAVVLAVLVGIGIAVGLDVLGLTDSAWWQLGPWLAGVGLLGGWQQVVTSDIGSWSVTAVGAPLLVTGIVAFFVAGRAKRGTWLGVLPAGLGAGAASALLVFASQSTQTVSNAAGTVTTTEGLTWWWGAMHPGTVVGAVGLVAVTWVVQTLGRTWWAGGRGVALALLVWLGLALTVAVAAGAAYLTSSTAVGIALALLYPLAGTLALFGAAGVPVDVSLTRLTPEALSVAVWREGVLYTAAGIGAALLLAVLVGLLLRLFKHRSTWLGALTVTPLLAAFLAWAMSTAITVPAALGTASEVVVNPLLAAVAGVVLAAVARFVAGRPKNAPAAPAPKPDADLDALLREVGVQ
jgi:hypothetical protein